MSLAELCAFYYWTLGAEKADCTFYLPFYAAAPPLPWYFSCYRCTRMSSQNEWFDLKVNRNSLGELKGTVGDNLPFTAVPSFPRPCFLFASKRMPLQRFSSHLTFIVIYWAFLLSVKLNASFSKKGKSKSRFFLLMVVSFFAFLSAESRRAEVVRGSFPPAARSPQSQELQTHSAIIIPHIKAIGYLHNPYVYLYFIILRATFLYCYLFMIPTASAFFSHHTNSFHSERRRLQSCVTD